MQLSKICMLAFFLAVWANPLFSQIDSSLFRRLEIVQNQIEDAAKHEWPAYTPTLYDRAQKSVHNASLLLEQKISFYKQRDAVIAAERRAEHYFQRAADSKKLLEKLMLERTAFSNASSAPLIRALAPREMTQAEQLFQQALQKAEQGELAEAEKLIPQVRKQYDLAIMLSYRVIPQRDLKKSLDSEIRELQKQAATLQRTGPADGLPGLDDIFQIAMRPSPVQTRPDGLFGDLFDGTGPFPPPTICTACPREPSALDITNRTATSLTLSWYDLADNEAGYRIYRWANTGRLLIDSVGPAADKFSVLSYVDSGLQPYTSYCYEVRSYNAQGESSAASRCGYTRDEGVYPVWRMQISLTTADLELASSDDDFYLEVMTVQGQEHTYTHLDYGRNDLQRGNRDEFDLNLDYVGRLSDINQIRLVKKGETELEENQFGQVVSNSLWALEELRIMVNDEVVYTRIFGNTQSTTHWMNGNAALTISGPELRAHPRWQIYRDNPALNPGRLSFSTFDTCLITIDRVELQERIEGMMGHLINDPGFEDQVGHDLYWDDDKNGDDWVELFYENERELRVNFDLSAETPGSNPEINLDLRVRAGINCPSPNRLELVLTVSIIDIQASSTGLFSAIDFLTGDALSTVINWKVDADTDTCNPLLNRTFIFDLPAALSEQAPCFAGNVCPTVSFDEETRALIVEIHP